MTTHVIFNAAHKPSGSAEFFMARQPVLDRGRVMVAFELRFRPVPEVAATVKTAEAPATTSVLDRFLDLQLLKVIGDVRGFIDIDTKVLMSDLLATLPCNQFVLNITDSLSVTEPMLALIEQLVGSGFIFALNQRSLDSEETQKLLPLVDIVKFDLRKIPVSTLCQVTPLVQLAEKKMLVQNVDTLDQFEACLALGFDYFQGCYFSKPLNLSGKKLSPSQLAITQVIGQIASDADSDDIEASVKRDVSLGLNLLRLVNTAAVGTHRIDSLRQALMVLGRNQLQRWLQIMLYAQAGKNVHSMTALLLLAATRGKLLELIAQRNKPGNRSVADTAFTVGIMSLMDVLFSLPMEHILQQLAVVDEVSDALANRSGYYGKLLGLVEHTELAGETDALLMQALIELHLSPDELYALQVEAFEWSNGIARVVR